MVLNKHILIPLSKTKAALSTQSLFPFHSLTEKKNKGILFLAHQARHKDTNSQVGAQADARVPTLPKPPPAAESIQSSGTAATPDSIRYNTADFAVESTPASTAPCTPDLGWFTISPDGWRSILMISQRSASHRNDRHPTEMVFSQYVE